MVSLVVAQFRFRRFLSITVGEGVPNYFWYAWRRVIDGRARLVYHVIGDSHTGMFRYHSLFRVHHLGPATAYQLGSESSLTSAGKKLRRLEARLPCGARLLFVMGEIDCRLHIYNQYMKQHQKVSLHELVERTMERYYNVLTELKSHGFGIWVCSIPPATTQENRYKYPFYGDIATQASLKAQFNEVAKEWCKKMGFVFVDIYSKVSTPEGFMNPAFSDDEVHLNRKAAKFAVDLLNEIDVGRQQGNATQTTKFRGE